MAFELRTAAEEAGAIYSFLSSMLSDRTSHFFTVDVEEYFQVKALEAAVSRNDWAMYPNRLAASIDILLDLLDRHSVHGTFFVLGWVAEYRPDVVRSIAAAGHEIASHGYWHERVTALDEDSFRQDVRSSKRALEDLIAKPVVGYRAPSFSIIPGAEWAFDVLIEEGYCYDSSVFPIRRRGYGYPGAPRIPYVIERPSGRLAEFPLATTSVGTYPLPAAGGGYLRQFPLAVIRRAFRQAEERGRSATFYIHPWEIDPEQPRLKVSAINRLRHYRGLANTYDRMDLMLREFRFGPIASSLSALADHHGPVVTAGAA